VSQSRMVEPLRLQAGRTVEKSTLSTSQRLDRTRIFADPNPHESVQIRVRFFEEKQEGGIAD